MNPRLKEILIFIAKRILPAVILSVTGICLVLTYGIMDLLGVPVFVLGLGLNLLALIYLAPTIARWIAVPVSNLFFPSERFEQPLPMYGIPRMMRKQRQHEEALEEYRKILEQDPQQLGAYLEMMEIAMIDLGDRSRAILVHQEGMEKLTEEKNREQLTRYLSRLCAER